RKRERFQTQAVMGFLERGKDGKPSQVQVFPVKKLNAQWLVGAIRQRVDADAELLCTDQSPIYKGLKPMYKYNHEAVNHIAEQYARRQGTTLITTNGIENFWSLFKRALVGQYHSVSVKHLPRYLDEATFKFNGRGTDLFRSAVQRMVNRQGLPYQAPVSDPS